MTNHFNDHKTAEDRVGKYRNTDTLKGIVFIVFAVLLLIALFK
jgi:hypothetical protein